MEREYQVNHIEKIVEEVSANRKVLAQLPTGGGKTWEFSLIAQRYCRMTGDSVLILVHREELLNQAAATIEKIMDIKPFIINSKTRKCGISRVYIGMVDSIIPRLKMMYQKVGLVIIDECHINNFNKIHNYFLEELVIGFTATPISSNKREPLNKYYRSIIVGPQISELIKLGHLSQNITRCPKDVVDSTKLEINKLKGDFDETKMAIEYKKPKNVTNVIKAYNKFCKGKKTIVFNVNIEHSKEVTECFNFMGYNARHLDSDSSNRPSSDPRYKNEREETLAWFKVTPDAILCNVMIATVGFDEPTIINVILNFSTLSLVKFIQCAGRGGRTIDEELALKLGCSPKNFFNIIDMGGNSVRFGDWNNDRDWRYVFEFPAKPGEGIAPVKTCPKCEGLVHASSRICDLLDENGEYCGYEFERKKTQEEQDLEEMILITKGIVIEDIVNKSKAKYQYFPMLEMAVDVIKNMYNDHLFPSENTLIKYFSAYYKLCIDWWDKFMKTKSIPSIENSAYHIKLAKNNFNRLVIKYKPEIVCEKCSENHTDMICEGCKKPTHKRCSPDGEFCEECYTNNKAHEKSVRSY